MELLLVSLLLWLEIHTPVNIKTVPEIHVQSQEKLEKLHGVPVHALYNWETRVVYIASDVDLRTVFGESVLLHELVHHWQEESGERQKYSCLREGEYQAYTIQRRYLEYKGFPLPDIMGEFNILMQASCSQ